MANNPFDQFDAPASAAAGSGNPFDQFDGGASKPAEAPSFTGSFSRGLKRTIPETKSLLAGAGAAVAGAVGADDVRDSLLSTYQDIQTNQVEPLANKSGFIDAVTGNGSLRDWAGDTLGNFAGQALQSVAAGAVGATLGSVVPGAGTVAGGIGGLVAKAGAKDMVEGAVARMVAKGVAEGVARKQVLAQLGGAAAATTGLNVGQEVGIGFTSRAEDAKAAGQDLTQQDALRAIGWGVPAGLVDTAAEALTGKLVGGGISTAPKMLNRVAKGAGVGAVTEGSTEGVQAVMERAGAGQDVTGEQAYKDYIENVAAGALGGAVPGAAGGLRRQQPNTPTGAPPVQAPAAKAPDPGIPDPSIATPPGPLVRAAQTLATPPGAAAPAPAPVSTPSAPVEPTAVDGAPVAPATASAPAPAASPGEPLPVFDQALQLLATAGKVSAGGLGKQLKLSKDQTVALMDELQARGIVSGKDSRGQRRLLTNPATGEIIDPKAAEAATKRADAKAAEQKLVEFVRTNDPSVMGSPPAAPAAAPQADPAAFQAKMEERRTAALTRAQRPDPAAGALSAAAASAFDTGAADLVQQQRVQSEQKQAEQQAIAESDRAAKEAARAQKEQITRQQQMVKQQQLDAATPDEADIRAVLASEMEQRGRVNVLKIARQMGVKPRVVEALRVEMAQARKRGEPMIPEAPVIDAEFTDVTEQPQQRALPAPDQRPAQMRAVQRADTQTGRLKAEMASSSQGLAASSVPGTAARLSDRQTQATSVPTPSARSDGQVAAPESQAPSGDSAYDTSADVLDSDITPPSGGAFSLRGAAEQAAKRTPGGKVFEVDGGYVVRTPRANSSETSNSSFSQAPATAAQGDRVKIATRFGTSVYVNRADLEGDAKRMRYFTSTGKPAGVIVRDNLDPTGEKLAESNREDESNPLFDVITTKQGNVFATEAAAARERNRRGLQETYDITPAGGGFVLKRKAAAPTEPAPVAAAQTATEPTNQEQSNGEGKGQGKGQDGRRRQGRREALLNQQAEAAGPQGPAVATHKDPGQPAEPATVDVIAEAAKTADASPRVTMAEARTALLKMVDEAIAKAPTTGEGSWDNPRTSPPRTESGWQVRDVTIDRQDSNGLEVPRLKISRQNGDGTFSVHDKEKVLGHSDTLLGARLLSGRLLMGAEWSAKGGPAGSWTFTESAPPESYVTFKVPGDGQFKVLNTKERLQAFRKQIEQNFNDRKRDSFGFEPLPSTRMSEAQRAKVLAEAEAETAAEDAKPKATQPVEMTAVPAKAIDKKAVAAQVVEEAVKTATFNHRDETSASVIRHNKMVASKLLSAGLPAWAIDRAIEAGRKAADARDGKLHRVSAAPILAWLQRNGFIREEATNPTLAEVTKNEPPSEWKLQQFIKIAADSVESLRPVDVERVIRETPEQFRQAVAEYIKKNSYGALDIEVDDVARELGVTMTPVAPDLKGFKLEQTDSAAFDLVDGNMRVSVVPMADGKFQASYRGAKSSPHLQSKQAAIDWAAGYRDESKRLAAPTSSVQGQKNLAARGARIAVLRAMNDRLRKLAPGDAWADSNINQGEDLDALQDQISAALVKAERGPEAENPLRTELEQMSGAELRDVFDRMGLAGARMTHAERVDALMAEDEADVRAAMAAVQPEATTGPADAKGERKFYVTMIRDSKVARIAGPFDTKEEADAILPAARDKAKEVDPRAVFDAFGVSAVTMEEHKPAALNEQLGIGKKAPSSKPAAADNLPTKFISSYQGDADYSVYIRRIGKDVRVGYDKDGNFKNILSEITEDEKASARASVERFVREQAAKDIKFLESRGLDVPADLRAKAGEPVAPQAIWEADPLSMGREQYVDARMESARNNPADPQYAVMTNYAASKRLREFDDSAKKAAELKHNEAAMKAAHGGKAVIDAVKYDYPGMFIRSDLSADQADEASDAMVAAYRDTKDYAKAVQVYRDFGAPQAKVPDGYKPAGEPFYRDGKQVQGYAKFAIGERVKLATGAQGVVTEFMGGSKGAVPVFERMMVKFDNGMEQGVDARELSAVVAESVTTATPPQAADFPDAASYHAAVAAYRAANPATPAAPKQDRRAEIKRELAALQQNYEKRMNRADGAVPPAIKADALAGIARKMDKLTAELKALDEAKATPAKPGAITDFGEKLPPARRAMAAKLDEALTDADIVNRPLNEIWPLAENEAIEDTFAAAVAHAARAEIPAKPRKGYKVTQWVAKVKIMRDLAASLVSGRTDRDTFISAANKRAATVPSLAGYDLRDWISKVLLLEQIDRSSWKRISEVESRPDMKTKVGDTWVAVPQLRIVIDDKPHYLTGDAGATDPATVDGNMAGILGLMAKDAQSKALRFEIRGSGGRFYIAKKDDPEIRQLMTFTSVEDARKAITEQYDSLVAAWQAIKDRDNITERDLRGEENRPRVGKDHRKGRDVKPEDFQEKFGFKGGEFGKWVQQGKGDKDRQTFLNNAYDSLMDLADLVGIPPRAISLNGTLGIAFGSRGSGWASAHFEPSNLVINLTKTRGAGALAHEWFHALDNYFSRLRGGEVKFTGSNSQYKNDNYITHNPEPLMVRKDGNMRYAPMTRGKLEATHAARKHLTDAYNPDNWKVDPKHREGVRPEVEARFADLVQALNDSPMTKRSAKLDKGKSNYWSSTLERAARAFEIHVIARLAEQGNHNDFLANVNQFDEMAGKGEDRYPYLLPGEVKPIADAFDALLNTVQTRTEPSGSVAMFAKGAAPGWDRNTVLEGWRELATKPDSFIYPTSEAIALEDIAAEVYPDLAIAQEVDELYTLTLPEQWVVKNAAGKVARVFKSKAKADVYAADTGGKVVYQEPTQGALVQHPDNEDHWFLSVADWKPGQDGARVYSVVLNWAHNNGKVLVPDPDHLTPINEYRRTEQMVASALRYGTTAHMRPDESQRVPWINEPTSKANNDANVDALLRRSYENGIEVLPELLEVDYDPTDTTPLEGDKDWTYGRFRDRITGVDRTAEIVRLVGTAGPRERGIGRTTLARIAHTLALLRGDRRAGRDAVLATDVPARPASAWSLIRRFIYGKDDAQQQSRRLTKLQLEKLLGPAARALKAARPGLEVIFVANHAELQAHPDARDIVQQSDYDTTVQAAINGDRTKVFFIAESIRSPRQALKLFAHEMVGHYSMEQMLGARLFTELRDRILALRDAGKWPEVFAEVTRRYERNADGTFRALDDDTFAAEAIAVFAEKNIQTSILQRALNALRGWLRKFFPQLNLRQGELRQMLWEAGQYLEGKQYRPDVAARALGQWTPKTAQEAISGLDPEQVKALIDRQAPPREGLGASVASFAKAGTMVDRLQKLINPQDTTLLERIKNRLSDWRPAALGALQLRHLGELAEDILPPVATYSQVVQRMATMRNELQELGHDVVDAGMKYQGANPEEAKKLFRMLHDATLAGVDPAETHKPLQMMDAHYRENVDVTPENVRAFLQTMKGQAKLNPGSAVVYVNRAKEARKLLNQERRRAQSHREMFPKFARLSPDAKKLWVQMRDAYRTQSAEYEKALISRIESLDFDKAQKAGQIARMRLMFESARVPFYIPLARWGEYWVSGTNAEGQREFYMQESAGDQQRVRKELADQGYKEIAHGVKLDTVRAQDGASASFMAEMDEMLKKSGAPDKIRDEAFQLYLRSLPDLSIRQNFIHRQGTPGYSQDALRALAGHIFHGSFQIARLRYSHELEAILTEAETMAKDMSKADDPAANAAGNIVNELKKRHEWVMNPQDNPVVNKISSVGFVYYLGLTPAAALVNLLQTPMVALPVLAGKHKVGDVTRELWRAMKQSLGTYGHMQKQLDGEELEAHTEFGKRGVFDKTQSANLAGISESDTHAYSPRWHKTMSVISHLFHKGEIFNREATAMAAYRLERAAGAGHLEAIEAADRAVHESHFDYSNANRARYMQSGSAKVLLMFRQYSLAVTWLLCRNLWQSMKGMDAQTRTEARRKLAGILGMTALFSGTLGLPLLGTVGGVMNALAAAFGDDDEPWDWETEFRAFMRDMLGDTGAEAVLNGPVQALTGVGIASRVSMGDLWFREPDRELEGRAWSNYLFEQAAGPMGGLITNFFRGQQLMSEGQVWRGVETMMPKALRDGMKSIRYLDEGVNNLRGDAIIEDLNVFESLAQIAGFSPASVATAYDTARDIKNYEQAILARRSRLMDAFALAWRLGDTDAREEILVKMRKFSQTYPELAITGDSIKRSLTARARASAQAENGVIVDKRIRARLQAQLGS